MRFEAAVPATVAATVVAFAAGSSSVGAVRDVAGALRWAVLLALVTVAAGWALERGALPAPRGPLGLAAAFLALALASSLWSVDPRLSAARAATLVVLLGAAALLAAAAAGSPPRQRRVLVGLVSGAAVVALLGLLLLAVDRDAAVQAATSDLAARYRGIGENPNTASMLFALVLPLTAWLVLASRSAAGAAAWGALVLLLVGSIGASGSRGALAAGVAGMLVVALVARVPARRRVAAGFAVVALSAAGVAAGEIAEPGGVTAPATAAQAAERARYANVEDIFPLSFDVGTVVSGRTLLGSSGRLTAWRGAIETGAERPLLGYGFGTEGKAFVDRYLAFEGGLPENSYIGVFLQLGVVGLALLGTLLAALVWTLSRAAQRPVVGAALGVLVAGLALAFVQSYVYSVGNIGTATLWISAFLGLAAARTAQEHVPG